MGRQYAIGLEGELECGRQLELRGWSVTYLNELRVNHPNTDLLIQKGPLKHWIQVKASRKPKGYITGGSVNPKITAGSAIFNRAQADPADFIIFLATEDRQWRHFIIPVSVAETIFRRNVDAYWGSPRLDGSPKRQSGQTDIFVGGGKFGHANIVPDQRSEIAPYESLWDLLERN